MTLSSTYGLRSLIELFSVTYRIQNNRKRLEAGSIGQQQCDQQEVRVLNHRHDLLGIPVKKHARVIRDIMHEQ